MHVVRSSMPGSTAKALTPTEIDVEKGSEAKLVSENKVTYPPLNSMSVLSNRQIAVHPSPPTLYSIDWILFPSLTWKSDLGK